jgi:hypothetical protein
MKSHEKIVSHYRGFDIVLLEYSAPGYLHVKFYRLYQNGEPASYIALYSEKAARNVIDTHIKAHTPSGDKKERL